MEHHQLASPLTSNKGPPALVILEEKGLGSQGKQLRMNIGIQGNSPPVFFEEHQLRHG